MNCKDCCQDCQRIGCDIEVGCSGYIEPSNGTKERMNERLEMIHKLYPDAKPTNADRIRSMTNAELARFFDDLETKNYFGEYLGELGWLEWLRQEV